VVAVDDTAEPEQPASNTAPMRATMPRGMETAPRGVVDELERRIQTADP